MNLELSDINAESNLFYLNSKDQILNDDFLIHTKKYCRYSNIQKLWIAREYFTTKNIKEILHKYKVSKSSLYKIVKDANKNAVKRKSISIGNINKLSLSIEEKQYIANYVKPPQIPLTIDKISQELYNNFGTSNKKREIKSFLKSTLMYSYKKGSSRTMKGGSTKTKLYQSIFASRILAKILEGNLIVNIDEWCF